MQAGDLVAALGRLIEVLALPGFVEVLRPIMTGNEAVKMTADQKQHFSQFVRRATVGYEMVQSDPELIELAEAFDLHRVMNWGNLSLLNTTFSGISNTQQVRTDQNQEPHRFWDLYYTAKTLIAEHGALESLVIAPRTEVVGAGMDMVDLIVYDLDGEGIPIKRLRSVMNTLVHLHESLSSYLEEESVLRLAYADTGSDTGIGAAMGLGVAEAIKSLFRDGLRHLRFWKEEGMERRWETIDSGLDLISALRQKAEAGEVDGEDAARLEHLVVEDMLSLLGDGVGLKEPLPVEEHDQRVLLKGVRRIRQLPPGEGDSDSSDAAEDGVESE